MNSTRDFLDTPVEFLSTIIPLGNNPGILPGITSEISSEISPGIPPITSLRIPLGIHPVILFLNNVAEFGRHFY